MSSGDPETRTRILEQTWHLMERSRGQEVRIEDIARAAGVSRQAVYLHFGSRAGLLIATARHVDAVKDAEQRVRLLREARGGAEALEALVDFWGNYMPEIHGLARALLAARETDEAAAAAWADRMQALRQSCNSVIRCLARDRLLAPEWTARQAGEALYGWISIEVWERLTEECGWSTREYITRMKATLRRAFIK
jgi:AcrR family transcriptional regulator